MTGMPLIVAHRGYSKIAPENTLAAYEAAIKAGAPAAECDVCVTSDGHVVLSHDATIDRCTDGTGSISQMTLAQVQSVDAGAWKDDAYAGQTIPTLRQALELTEGRLHLIVEVKQAGAARQVAEVIGQMQAIDECTIISFNLDTCGQMRRVEPRLAVGWLTGGLKAEDDGQASDLIHTALSANVQFLDVAANGIPPELMRRADLSGVTVWTWTVNSPDLVRHMAGLGVKGITTDDPVMALEVLYGTGG